MDAKLQQAIDASRAGDKVEAQKILVELLQENPDEVQGWYLLSLLVDAKEQQAAYAAKALALDPNHEKAQERLTHLQAEPALAATAVTTETPDFITQEQGDTLPDWMAGDEELVAATAVAATEPPTDGIAEEELPDWIQEPVSDSWMKSGEPAPVAKTTAAKPAKETAVSQPKAAKTKKKKPKKKLNRLDLILALLVIAVIIIIIYLLYLVTSG